jgi:uncharacterized protein YqgV (UPF0045/DUF77 family)
MQQVVASIRVVPLGTATSSKKVAVEKAVDILKSDGVLCATRKTCTEMQGT